MNNGNPRAGRPIGNERYNLRPRRAARAHINEEVQDGVGYRARQRPRRPNNEGPPPRRRRLGQNPVPIDLELDPARFMGPVVLAARRRRLDEELDRPARFMGDGYIEPWPFNIDMGDVDPIDLVNVESDEEEEEDEESEDDSDTNSNSSNEPPIPLFPLDEDEAVEYEPDDEDNGQLFWPFEPFMEEGPGGNLMNFMDVFRRIAYGLNSTRSSIQLDTLPAVRPLDPNKVDLYKGNMPPQGAIPMHRSFLVPPFASCIVDSMPNQMQRRHIFLTNYTRDCWNGLQEAAKQTELRTLKSRIWCTTETAKMIKRYYPLLYLEVRDLLHTLVPNRLYQILPEDPAFRLSVMALPLDNIIPGSCVYLMSREKTFLLHTGTNAAQDSFTRTLKKIKEVTPTVNILYIDSALYFPGANETFRQKLDVRSTAMMRIKAFMTAMVGDEDHDYFFSIRYRAGMEGFLLDIVSWVQEWKVGLTADLFEWNYAELLQYRAKLLEVDHLDSRHLSPSPDQHERARIFFYTDEYSEFDHIYCTNSDHIKLHVIYDYHSSIERLREPRCCANTIYQKCRAFNNDSEEELTYYALYPSHPTTDQIKTVVKQTMPDRIFGLARAPGVGYAELKDEFKKLTDSYTKRSTAINRPIPIKG